MASEQVEISVKILLKQVYAAHLNKIRALDEEIEDLKNKLSEAVRIIKQTDTKCKRCIELEEAFNSCKTALIEQSRRFENLGQKFSVFNSSPKKQSKNERSLSMNETGSKTLHFTEIGDPITSAPKKSSTNPLNLFKNYASFNTAQTLDSLDLCSQPFLKKVTPDYSTLNSDSVVLAPDTVDVIENADVKRNKKIGNKSVPTITVKVSSMDPKNLKDDTAVKESNGSGQRLRKRMLPDPSDSDKSTKRLSLDKSVACSNPIKSVSMQKTDGKELIPPTNFDHEKPVTDLNLIAANEKEAKNSLKEKSATKSLGDFLDKPSDISIENENKDLPLDVIVLTEAELKCDDHSVETISDSKETLNVTAKDCDYQVSPSLLQVKTKLKSALNDQDFGMDDGDFQSPILNKKVGKDNGSKPTEDDTAWTACDKKKLKKRQPLKIFKSTSKFKLHLDALPPNYKKPTYKQTKLSQSIFQPKVSSISEPEKIADISIHSSSDESNSAPNIIPSTSKSNAVDFDATCIPENFEIISSGNKENKSSKNSLDNTQFVRKSDCPKDPESPSNNILKEKAENSDSNDNAVFEDFISNPTGGNNKQMNSFDRLPKREEPKFKYKEETIRKKSERKQLDGFDCKECENYYTELGLTDKEKQERLKKCSRHRAKFAAPATPEHFWELEFPDTQECKARGYLNETQKVKLKTHRRRPLE